MTDRSADWETRRRAWESGRLGPALDRAPERRGRFSTIGDTTIERVYDPGSLPASDPLRDIGLPGRTAVHARDPPDRLSEPAVDDADVRRASAPPRTRTRASASCSRPARPACRSPTTCRRCTATTRTTPEAEGEFGTCGVGVCSLADMEVLLDGLPLDRVSTSMTINSPGGPDLGDVHRGGREGRRPARRSSRAPPRTTSSRSSSPRRSSCSRPSRRCAW